MPRLALGRAGPAAAAALALLALALPPDTLRGALASAAASVFEATPFVLAAALLPGRLARIAPLAACGCGGLLPGALAPAAVGLCWLLFGPWVTLARTAVALAVARLARSPAGRTTESSDPLEALALVGACSFAGSLLGGILGGSTVFAPAALLGGALAGALLPCPTAALTLAAQLGTRSGWTAAGLLLTAGFLRFTRAPRRPEPPATRTARAAYLGVAIASGCLCLIGCRGFLNPKLIALPLCGAIGAACAASRRKETALHSGWVVPAALIVALAAGSPAPPETTSTLPLGLYPGATLDFTGIVGGHGTRVGRAAIVCCRADARLLAVSLSRPLREPDGVWVRVRGTMKSTPGGLRLDVRVAAAIPAPIDPFVYM